MKNYEKAYNEALERAKSAIKDCGDNKGRISMIESIFPELKESEDERIRKVLVDFFKNYKTQEELGIKTFFGIKTNDILAWLEKQGEQKVG